MFAEEFVLSYERQINEFKRLGPSASAHPAPVLEPLAEEDFEAEADDALDDEPDDNVNAEPTADQAEA